MTNEEISLRTKQQLAQALKECMRKKPFSKITVSEIIRACQVNRKTFYYHFTDIYALLQWIFEEEAIAVVQHFDLLVDYREAITFVVEYVEKNDYLISCAYDSIGRDEMKRFFCKDFYGVVRSVFDRAEEEKQSALDPDFKDFLVRFYTEALAGILMDLVQERDPERRKKTMEYVVLVVQTQIGHLVDSLNC